MPTVQSDTFIQYGRKHRKPHTAGLAIPLKSAPPSNEESLHDLINESIDPRKAKVIAPNVWDRIQFNLHGRRHEMERIKKEKEEKEKAHLKMIESIQKWPNTLEGDHLLKQETRRKREEADEADKQLLDIKEAKYQAEKRREVIEKAKTDQYFQTDSLKAFHEALRKTEVLIERDAQLKMKNCQFDYKQAKEAASLKHSKNENKRLDLEEQLKQRERYLKNRQNANFHLFQAEQKKNQKKIEKEAEMEERRRMIKFHDFCNWESEKLEQLKEEESGLMKKILDEQIENNEIIANMDNQLDDEELKEANIFSNIKRKINNLRRQRESELLQERMDHRKKMADDISSLFQEKYYVESENCKRAAKEKQEKKDKEEAMKLEKRNKTTKKMVEYLKQQMRDKDKIAVDEKAKGLEERKMIEGASRLWLEQKTITEEEKRERNKNFQNFQLDQINEKAEMEREERQHELDSDQCLVGLIKQEKEELEKFADEVISEVDRRGFQSYPLRKVVANGFGSGRGPPLQEKGGVRPSYMAADRRTKSWRLRKQA